MVSGIRTVILMAMVVPFVVANSVESAHADDAAASKPALPVRSGLPADWAASAPRDEIRPAFTYHANGGPAEAGAFVITAGDSAADHGFLEKSFPVSGGNWYRFAAVRKTSRIPIPRRSAPVRVVWLDDSGKPVPADLPPELHGQPGSIPQAAPEHPVDGPADSDGWTTVTGVYRAPSKAARAVVELHLRWAAGGSVTWADVRFTAVPAPAPRPVRLAAVHYTPSGKSPRANCEEYAPFVAEAAKRRADLVVLGETVPYVGVGKKPHEVAEPIPGPTTDYFGKLASKHKLHLVVSLFERSGRGVYNSAVLLGPTGKLVGKYRKVCLPYPEVADGVTPGDEYPVFETPFGKVGMMICYDGFYPEVARELVANGAEVIAWPVWGCNPLLAQARACENHVYLVSSTYTDRKRDWTVTAVYDHAGKPIVTADEWGEVVVAEVDLARPYFWRNGLGDFRSLAHRTRPARPPEAERHADRQESRGGEPHGSSD